MFTFASVLSGCGGGGGGGGPAKPPLAITAQPADVTVVAGAAATLNVSAS
ncbi:MAG: hypothetical protein H7276_00035, partial [Caulobacter sp.]|nr:hypothetical protein [Vitreoscilla sp.]